MTEPKVIECILNIVNATMDLPPDNRKKLLNHIDKLCLELKKGQK